MTSEKDAPAEMPGVEEIGQALAIFFANNRQPCMSGDPRDRLSPLRRRDLDDATSAILALFAPIMAGEERTALRRETRALSQAQEWRNIAEKAEARALAAEAALKLVAEQDVTEIALDPDWPRRICAAAIRAQGE